MEPPTNPPRSRTFLIGDVRGYTRFTRERGDLEAARLATRFAELAGDAVASRSGRVVEVRGDEVLAVFDGEAQAVRAALELQATLAEEMAADGSLPLNVGIGIDAGEAVPVGDGFRGAALNLAARLCARAEAGQVLVTATVRDRSAERTAGRFQPLGPADVKGFDHPVEVFEVVSPSGRLEALPRVVTASELPPPLATESEIVGRDDELRWLRGAWRSARRGAGRMLVVSGAEGMGKTALAVVFAGEVAEQGFTVLHAGAGGAALAQLGDVCRTVRDAGRPVLAVLDDLSVLGDQAAEELAATFDRIESVPALVLCLVDADESSPRLLEVISRADADGDGHRFLASLDAASVERIAASYAGEDVDQVPLDAILRGSSGTPARVHELLDVWAGEEAARRLEAAAQWLAAGRDRRTAGLAFAHNAIERRLAHLYDASPAPSDDPPCPYKGLAAFDQADAAAFFGRERLVGELAARTVATGLLALVGPSGSGKSSLMLAGLVPSLQAGLLPGSARWGVAVLRPGAHPVAELDASWTSQASSDERLVVAVDQFEEVFTLCASEAERSAFIGMLAALAAEPDRFIVVLAVRGDFLDRIALYPPLAQLVSANQVLVPPMARDEYRRAIEQPARRAGVRVESSLTEVLLDEAVGEPGALPLLSTALVDLWWRRQDGWMRLETFTDTGGLRGAVSRLAESSFARLDEPGQRTARTVFLRLAGSGEGDAVTRARVPVGEFDLDGDPHTAAVIDRFVADRLLIRDEGLVEVAHEALLREWPRARTWLEEEGQGRLLRQHLTQAARYWDDNGRRTGDLYRAERLSAAQAWSAEHGDQLNALEREFLDASQAASTREIRRLRAGIAVLAVLLAAALIGGVIAIAQRRSAQSAATRARDEATRAIADNAGVQAEGVQNLSTGLVLAAAAERLHPSPETDASLIHVLARAGAATTVYHIPTRALGVTPSPDGSTVAVTENNGRVGIFDPSTGRLIWQVPDVDGAAPFSVAYTPDGRTLVLGSMAAKGGGLVVAVDVRTHRVIATANDGRKNGTVLTAGISPDGRTVAALSAQQRNLNPPRNLQLWRLSLPDLRPIGRPLPLPSSTASLFFTRADQILTTTSTSTDVRDATGRLIRTFGVVPLAVSPDGHAIAIARHGRIGTMDLTTGRAGGWVRVPGGVQTAAFTPSGGTLAVVSGNTLEMVDPRSGVVTTLGRDVGGINGVATAPDGSSVYTSSLGGKAAVRWGLHGGLLAPTDDLSRALPMPFTVSEGGRGVVATVGPQGVYRWNLGTGRPIGAPLAPGPGGIGWVAVSPDGRSVAAVNYSTAQVTIWDTATGKIVRQLTPPGHRGSAWVTYSPNGKLIAVGTQIQVSQLVFKGGRVDVWNADSGRLLDSFRQPGNNGLSTVYFSGDSRRVVGTGEGGSVAVWDLASGKQLNAWRTSDAYTSAAVFSQHGNLVATAGYGGGLVSLWRPLTATRGNDVKPPIVSSGQAYPVGFYAGGHDLAIAHNSPGEVELWDIQGRRLIGSLPVSGPNTMPGATLSPDGRTLITLDPNTGVLTRWPLSPSVWAADACRIAGVQLTVAEWSTYLHGVPYQRACPA